MGTEKFIAFKEDGTAYRLKGRILRFLDNEPVSEDDKTNIRSTLSVPASGEGLTPANNLSDLNNVATARTNLSVNSKDEDAQANALKTTSPALYFSGSSYVTVADDDRFSFTDGTDDLPFSISAWVKMKDASAFVIASKHVSAREWVFRTDGSDKLLLNISDTTNTPERLADSALTAYEGSWVHVCATYAGSGPSVASGNAFSAAADGVTLYVNGSAVASTASNSGSYTGMSNGEDPVTIGKQTSTYAKGHIRGVKIFNRSLTTSEVAELARGNDLGFSEEWGTNTELSSDPDFTGGDYTAAGGASVDTGAGTATIPGATGYVYISTISGNAGGKKYRLTYTVDSVSGTPNTYIYQLFSSNSINASRITLSNTPGTYHVEFDGKTTGTNAVLGLFNDAASSSVTISQISIRQIGTLADFRAEDYNESASKLLDRSSNNFVGVGTSVTLTGNQRHISADTIDLKNLPTSSAGLSAGEVWSNGGVLTVV